MILTLIGLSLNFVGTLAIILETISGGSIRPKVYSFVFRGVNEITMNQGIRRMKLTCKEIRVLLWVISICGGFLFQILDLIIPLIKTG